MLQILCDRLMQKGILDNTVFVISADHYPYGMSDDESLAALYGLPEKDIRTNKELFRNQMLIWSSSMKEAVKTDKYCSSMDLIPTVYNLFGIDYDSRLLMGSDVMSDTPGFVIINNLQNNWNWITDYGYYDTAT
jgi:phosphoglycerol transferase MdoB-like AlkP superfamily enzyme